MRKAVVSAAVLLAASVPGPEPASAATPECAGLAGVRIPASVMSLPTSGGIVTAASAGAYCRVDAELFPVDPAAPAIKLRVALPRGWNHKALMFGGGGFNGTIPDVTANVPFGPADRPAPLARGYATFASDSGHQQNPASPPSLDGSFGMNDEALVNFAAGDALKKTRDA
ncbi:tannase/feruloyl esterase family alpha/beta hydrolase, partial [Amycolatopsis sp.]|uniref:tannase/feruloyl esterase family alpha/beta hydrolase n=1 Tax=Amycolatopsis sp. TaxID=37632 RepID=UPI002D8107A8